MTKVDRIPPEEILYRLARKGWRCVDIDRAYGLKLGMSSMSVRLPHQDAELAVAEVLGLSPRQIWPERYDAFGSRLKPQPRQNYIFKKRPRHCQKNAAA